MVKESDISDVRHGLNSLRDNYKELERLMEYAETLEADAMNNQDVADQHQTFLDDLEAFYYTVENVLAQADRIENQQGELKHDLPATVPQHILDRVANRPADRPGPAPPGESDGTGSG